MIKPLSVVAMGIALLVILQPVCAQRADADKLAAFSKALRTAKDAQARREAAGALGGLGEPGLNSLLRALQDRDWQVRHAAAYAICQMGRRAKSATPDLINALKDESPHVRAQSAAALAAIGLPEVKTSIHALIELLEKDRCCEAASALGTAGPDAKAAVPMLIKSLQNGDLPSDRAESARALGLIGVAAKEATPQLAKALADEDAWVRFRTCAALAQIGPEAKAARPALLAKMQDRNDKQVAAVAALALKTIDPENKVSIPFLIKMLKEENLFDRCAAVACLEELGPAAKEAVPALSEFLRDPCDPIIEDVKTALKKIGVGPEKKK